MGYKTNGVDTGGLPHHLVFPIIEKYSVPFFIETGTANGDSVMKMAYSFKKIWTIELIEGRQEKSIVHKHINWLVGDSVEILPNIIKEIKQSDIDNGEGYYTLFYLDAHYSGDTENETSYPECPLLKEIECVAENGYHSIIIIDDARLFLAPPPYPHNPKEWPSILEIFLLLKEKFPYSWVTIIDDYVLSVPLHVKDIVEQEWRNRYSIRYPSHSEIVRNSAKLVYQEFLKYISIEK